MLKISARMRWLGLVFAALTLTIACTRQPQTTTTAPTTATSTATSTSQPLISATNNWIGHAGHYVAVKKGLFTEAGLKVEDLFFQSSTEMGTAFVTLSPPTASGLAGASNLAIRVSCFTG